MFLIPEKKDLLVEQPYRCKKSYRYPQSMDSKNFGPHILDGEKREKYDVMVSDNCNQCVRC